MVHCKLVPLKNPIIPMNLVPLNNIKSKKVYSDVPLEESEDKPKVEPPKNPHQPQHPVPLKQSPEPTRDYMYFLVQLTGQYTSTQVPFRVSYTGNLRQNLQFGIVTSQAIIDDCSFKHF